MDSREALEILELGVNATPIDIKQAYRDLVKVWHPDRFPNDPRFRRKGEDKLKKINAAFAVLQEYTPPTRVHSKTQSGSSAKSRQEPHTPYHPKPKNKDFPYSPNSMLGGLRLFYLISGFVVCCFIFSLIQEPKTKHSDFTISPASAPNAYQKPRASTIQPVQKSELTTYSLPNNKLTTEEIAIPNTPPTTQSHTDATAPDQKVDLYNISSIKDLIKSLNQPKADISVDSTSEPTPETIKTSVGAKLSSSEHPRLITKDYFTIGSTKDEVLTVQGTPEKFTERLWQYGLSSISFNGDQVVSWNIYSTSPLKARMLPSKLVDTSKDYFTIGSTKDEVLTVQGTPEKFTERLWQYGLSSISFNGDQVVSWNIYSTSPLKVKIMSSKNP